MAEINTRGKPFDNRGTEIREYSAYDDRLIIKKIARNGVGGTDDLKVTATDNYLYVAPGFCVVEGTARQFDSTQTLTAASSVFGYVIAEMNDLPDQGVVTAKVIYQAGSYPELTQTDVVYQMPLASFATDASGNITNLIDKRTLIHASDLINIDYRNTNFDEFMRGFMAGPTSVFDPIYYNGPAHGHELTNAFSGGVLAPNGKIILIPYDFSNIGIYDPMANTYTDGPAHGQGGWPFSGGVLAPNGKIILIPRDSSNIGIYDPIANTYINGPAHGHELTNAFSGGVLAPNGKIILIPYQSSNIGIYDPMANTYIDGPAHGQRVSDTFSGGVLAPNGKIILIPSKSSNIGIYDPIANTYTDGPEHGQGSYAFRSGVLAPSGKIIMVPDKSSNIGIYDPMANTYIDGPAHGQVVYSFSGGVLAPNGKIIMIPAKSSNIGIYDMIGREISNAYCIHPYLNTY